MTYLLRDRKEILCGRLSDFKEVQTVAIIVVLQVILICLYTFLLTPNTHPENDEATLILM